MNTAYCILHEEMVEMLDDEITGIGHTYSAETEPGLPELNFCEFPDGLAFTPPPEFNMDEWMKTAEPPTDEELAIMDEQAELWTP
jgi:hypothetical protein